MTSAKGPGLYEFLIESELQQYYNGIKNDLKIQNVAQLKYVAEEDLHQIGMSKPEMRRLKKFFQRHYPQNYIHKFKKLLLARKEEPAGLEPTPPERPREGASSRLPNKHMIPVESILVNKQLGQGEFGVVQQGVWTNDGDRIQVAIKCLSRDRMHNNPIEFLKEAAILHAIDHEHIVRLYGCVLDSAALMLVTELAPLRSLLECLKEPGLRASFPVLSLCDFAIQVCDGMQYLEAKRLIHRDLAARNILVFSKHQVKISDFGLSRALGVGKDYYQTNFNVNLKLPIAWCAPECISYLRFTSASDVWAYGVTLWEMFSYGFQPWAALTGHQILEAIDTPNHQRLEQPECCPKEYFSLMLRCWQHDPNKRPRFADLAILLPECKPEQVKAVQEPSPELKARDQLAYRAGDVITVLDKGNALGCWKGALVNGKTGLFSPNNTVTYLGDDLPSSKPAVEPFKRGDSKHSSYASCRRLRADMISSPQGDVKHTGHVGLDGAYFGDVGFMGKTQHALPHLAVAPYKPAADCGDGADPAHPLLGRTRSDTSDRQPLLKLAGTALAGPAGQPGRALDARHEYHEITDEESPHSEKSFDFGPSLLAEMDAVFRQLGGNSNDAGPPPPTPPDPEAANTRNELRELAAAHTAANGNGKKKHAAVKPISAHDQRTLDSAIAMATELAARSMGDGAEPASPRSPPQNKRKFSFRFPPTGGSGSGGGAGTANGEKRSFSDEAERITDVQSCISDSARQVYSSLVEQGEGSPPTDVDSPLRLLRTFPAVRPRCRGNKHRTADDDNPIPLPPRDRTRPLPPSRPRHQRKHPLLLLPADPTKSRQDDSFEQRIATELAALDEMPPDGDDGADETPATEEGAEPADTPPSPDEERESAEGQDSEPGGLLKHGDHVSCEDLLEFACDAPNAARTRGPLRGLLSDEARVMRTVLGIKVEGTACVEALDACSWDVHHAIKLERLRALLRGERPLSMCHRALDACAWDVAAAALWVQAESQ